MAASGLLYTFYTLTPLHAGSGDSQGVVDLPIQREKHTEFPVVFSSSLKGSLRYLFENDDGLKSFVPEIFGKEGTESSTGNVVFTDAKVLLFPVRSSEGVFKWITSPFVLRRFTEDIEFISRAATQIGDKIDAGVTDDSAIGFKKYDVPIVLEDFVLTASDKSSDASLTNTTQLLSILFPAASAQAAVNDRLLIVSDSVFKELVKVGTQVIARNELKENKISNNLWYEEVVPPDALFYTVMRPRTKGNESITDLGKGLTKKVVQIGGNETIGYGFVQFSADLVGNFQEGKVDKEGKNQ